MIVYVVVALIVLFLVAWVQAVREPEPRRSRITKRRVRLSHEKPSPASALWPVPHQVGLSLRPGVHLDNWTLVNADEVHHGPPVGWRLKLPSGELSGAIIGADRVYQRVVTDREEVFELGRPSMRFLARYHDCLELLGVPVLGE